MTCPKCCTENTACIDSRQQGFVRRRRYKCLECGERFTTQERVVVHKTERSEDHGEV